MRKRFFTQEQEQEIIAFYTAPNSAKAVWRTFGVSLYTLRLLLTKYNIPEHTIAEVTAIGKAYIKKTCLKKYGVESSNQATDVKAKIAATKMERYGKTNWTNPEKAVQTKLERYGDPHYNNQEKTKQTNLAKYGVENSFQAESVKEKIRCTCLEQYGVKFPSQIKTRIEKSRLTFTSRTDEEKLKTKQKTIITNYQRYGAAYFSQTKQCAKTRHCRYMYNGEYLDSFPELCFYMYNILNSIKIERTNTAFEYMYNDRIHYYFPDFKIAETYIELKGSQFLKDDGSWRNPYNPALDEL